MSIQAPKVGEAHLDSQAGERDFVTMGENALGRSVMNDRAGKRWVQLGEGTHGEKASSF